MNEFVYIFLALGVLLLIGLVTNALASNIRLPRVTLLLIVGILIGPSFLDLIPEKTAHQWFTPLTYLSLAVIGFLLGSKMTFSFLKKTGHYVIGFSIAIVLASATCVFIGLIMFNTPVSVALLLAGLSTAAAPTTTTDVIREVNAKGPFTRVLMGISAVDSIWTLILFSICMSLVSFLLGESVQISTLLLHLSWEILGALIVGFLLGLFFAFILRQIKSGEPKFLEALCIVLFGCGVALYTHVSFILALIMMGATVTNLVSRPQPAFKAIEYIQWPFMTIFFIIAGSQLEINMLVVGGLTGSLYIFWRFVGRILSSYLGGIALHADATMRHWVGLALVSQAGLAIGLTLIAAQSFPQIGKILLPIVLGSTVIFEILGPILTRIALIKSGEANQN